MRQQYTENYLAQQVWRSGGTITTQQALLGATALSHSAIKTLADAKKVLIDIPQGWVAMELRFYSDGAENVDDIVELYAEAGEDHYRHFAQLTIVVGTQNYGSYHFHDIIIPANEAWMSRPNEISQANNTFASYVLNTHCYSRILIIASDLDSSTIGVDYKRI